MVCKKCAHENYCVMAQFGGHAPLITACSKFKENSQTNGDRIRAMTDEELANFLFPLGSCPIIADGLPFNESADCADDCEKCWLDWLKKEVESDG